MFNFTTVVFDGTSPTFYFTNTSGWNTSSSDKCLVLPSQVLAVSRQLAKRHTIRYSLCKIIDESAVSVAIFLHTSYSDPIATYSIVMNFVISSLLQDNEPLPVLHLELPPGRIRQPYEKTPPQDVTSFELKSINHSSELFIVHKKYF